jgi:hypothetical protein
MGSTLYCWMARSEERRACSLLYLGWHSHLGRVFHGLEARATDDVGDVERRGSAFLRRRVGTRETRFGKSEWRIR